MIQKDLLFQLKKEYGEAFYLLDSKQFKSNFQEFKKAFSSIYPHFNIAYSYKTNYTPKICKIIHAMGGYAEVVSEMELELAYRIGVAPDRIIWNGPIKEPQIMKDFLVKGGTVNVDSMEEWTYVKQLATEYPETLFHIGIRCNFDVHDGVLSRFGFDTDSPEFSHLLQEVQAISNLELVSLQCHFAKRQIEFWPDRVKGMLDLIDRYAIIPQRIDLGGGLFGKIHPDLEKQFSFAVPSYQDYAEIVASAFAERFATSKVKPELVLEPGSALVGDCMQFVGTVKTIKQVRGKTIATILGSQKNISMTGINPPIELFSETADSQNYQDVDFVGFTCIESDLLYKHYEGPLSVGDVVVFYNCGSYSLVMKPPFILPNFPVLDISEGDVELIKKAEHFDHIFQTFIF